MSITLMKKLGRQMEKELKTVQQIGSELETSITKFNEMLEVLESGNEVKDTRTKRGPGRPPKNKQEGTKAKRGPGRPPKNKQEETKAKRGPGRPPKNKKEETKAKRGPGRPPKNKKEETKAKRGPGCPPKNSNSSTVNSNIVAEMDRIMNDYHLYNMWAKDKDKQKEEVWVIQNGTYVGIIAGFYSRGTSGKFCITTKVYLNPYSDLVPEELKFKKETRAINRIRYVDTKEEGLEYIDRQKEKLSEELFSEIVPKVIANHGQKGSDYAFHLKTSIRSNFRKMKALYDKEYAAKLEKNLETA